MDRVESNKLPTDQEDFKKNQEIERVKGLKSSLKTREDLGKCKETSSERVEAHVRELVQRFNPPNCRNCPKRKADRVCLNFECGPKRFQQIICGRCHLDQHSISTCKPEISIEEYFVNLAIFMNEESEKLYAKSTKNFDQVKLKPCIVELNKFRVLLAELKQEIRKEIDSLIPQNKIPYVLEECITKALSSGDCSVIQTELNKIKGVIRFTENQFSFKSMKEHQCVGKKSIEGLEQAAIEIRSSIKKAFLLSDCNRIDLKDVSVLNTECSLVSSKPKEWDDLKQRNDLSENMAIVILKEGNESMLEFNSSRYQQSLYYLNFRLNNYSMYRLRFSFVSCFGSNINLEVQILPVSKLNNLFQQIQYPGLRFNSLYESNKDRMSVEMNVSIDDNYYDIQFDKDNQRCLKTFSVFPYLNQCENEDFFFIFWMHNSKQCILIESFEEIASISNIQQ